MLPRIHRLSDIGSDPLLELVDSWFLLTVAVARPAGLGEAGRPPSGPSRALTLPRLCSALGHYPGKWVHEIFLILGCLVILWMDVEAFRCIQLNQGLTLDLEPLDCFILSLVRSRGLACGSARPAGLGFCPILLNFGTLIPEIKTHPKLMELVRNKQNMNGT